MRREERDFANEWWSKEAKAEAELLAHRHMVQALGELVLAGSEHEVVLVSVTESLVEACHRREPPDVTIEGSDRNALKLKLAALRQIQQAGLGANQCRDHIRILLPKVPLPVEMTERLVQWLEESKHASNQRNRYIHDQWEWHLFHDLDDETDLAEPIEPMESWHGDVWHLWEDQANDPQEVHVDEVSRLVADYDRMGSYSVYYDLCAALRQMP